MKGENARISDRAVEQTLSSMLWSGTMEHSKYTFVTCPVCKKINYVELDRFDQALCGGCRVKLSKVLDDSRTQ